MRERELVTVITFPATTAAMEMEKRAQQCGFSGGLIPVPREIAAGCGMAWKCGRQEEAEARSFVRDKKLTWQGIYRVLL